jgi:hypothetical protein
MAIGAIATAMADGPEAVRVRLVRLLVAACAAALSAFAGAVTGGYPWLAVPTLAAWAFVCGFVVVLGADATTVGLNSLVVFIVLEHSALDPFRAASLAALVFGGGLVTIIASALALPSRVSPPQRAIAPTSPPRRRTAMRCRRSACRSRRRSTPYSSSARSMKFAVKPCARCSIRPNVCASRSSRSKNGATSNSTGTIRPHRR